MAKEDDECDLERGPRPVSVRVVAAPPSNIVARPRPAVAANTGGDHDDDESERKIPNYVWVSLRLLLTAVVCSPLVALALMRTDAVEKAVLAVVMLPVFVGVFFILLALCKRPRMAAVADVVKSHGRFASASD